jgi:DNA-binding beta-propeller fold protein YncE
MALMAAFSALILSSCRNESSHYYSVASMDLSASSAGEPPPLSSPARIALLPDGDLLVSDYKRRMVFTIDGGSLEVLDAFSVQGRLMGVAVGEKRIFVGNESDGDVEVYNRKGKLLKRLGDEEGLVKLPSDIAVDRDKGLVFVVDAYEGVVLVFDPGGPLLYTIPAPGVVQEQLTAPTGIALDEERGEAVISDYGDPASGIPARIKVYGYSGLFRFWISGDAVSEEYRFSRPQGLAVDKSGNIFMADGMLGKVLVFDRVSRQGIKAIGEFGSEEGQLFLPLDVVVDAATDDVFVTNNRPGRIEAFRDGGALQ